ncbi:MAG: hypothetical protein R3F30_11435 [Planctomycetota bacterium]
MTALTPLVLLAVLVQDPAAPEAERQSTLGDAPIEWPLVIPGEQGAELVLLQPQAESWTDHRTIEARMALAYKPVGADRYELGALRFKAATSVDFDEHMVLLDVPEVLETTFPAISPGRADVLGKAVARLFPRQRAAVPLERVLASLDKELASSAEAVLNPVPRLIVATEPTICVRVRGKPQLEPVAGASCAFVRNTDAALFRIAGKHWYLQFDASWLEAESLEGPWTQVERFPDPLRELPRRHPRWAYLAKTVPGKKLDLVPAIQVIEDDAELLQFFGKPRWEAVPGTKVEFVANTENDVLRVRNDPRKWLLIGGRWFVAEDWTGEWSFATDELPEEFRAIPEDHYMARVLASVPGTEAARQAVLEARIPRLVRIEKAKASASFSAVGEAVFEAIPDTDLSWCTNTCQELLERGGRYWLCERGAWFTAGAVAGPYELATETPEGLDKIPVGHPMRRLAAVKVHAVDDTYVVAGYDAGYVDLHVDRGVLVKGDGRPVERGPEYWIHCHALWASRPAWGTAEDHPLWRDLTSGVGWRYDHVRNDFDRGLWARRTGFARDKLVSPLASWPRDEARRYRPDERGGRRVGRDKPAIPADASGLFAGKDDELYRFKGDHWERRAGGKWEPCTVPPAVAKAKDARDRDSSGRKSGYEGSRYNPFPAGTVGGIMLAGH